MCKIRTRVPFDGGTIEVNPNCKRVNVFMGFADFLHQSIQWYNKIDKSITINTFNSELDEKTK